MSETKPEHASLMREIHERWRLMPPMRIAHGLKDAVNDWPIASFGDDERRSPPDETWISTDRVHASEHVHSAPEIADVLVKSRDDIRALFKIIAELGGPK